MKKTFLVLVIIMSVFTSFSQKALKLAHVDVQSIFSVMPEKEAATKEVETYAKTLEDQMQILYKEYETKANEYKAGQATWSDLIRQTKEEEIMSLQTRIQNFQTQAEADLQNKEAALLEPITAKIKDAIKTVAAAQGLSYVVDAATLLYISPESIDITADVKTKLGIK